MNSKSTKTPNAGSCSALGLMRIALCMALVLLMCGHGFGQCANNNTAIAGGVIIPNCPGTTNVPCVRGGQYALVSVEIGNLYTFSVCGASFDTQLTLYNNAGGGALGYNDDFCGTASQITWNASFTGDLRVLVDRYNCANNTTCAPLVITCGPTPPAAPEDCIGAVTICADDAFSSTTNNTGMVVDLNGSNRGCLDPERQGTWYVFAPSEPGNIGFNISVAGTSAYDWAIWGPYTVGTNLSALCPPTGPPIRCEASSAGGTNISTGSYTKGMGHGVFNTPQYAPPTGCPTCSAPATPPGSCPYTPPRYCGWVPGLQVQVGEMYLMYIDNWYQTGLAFELDWVLEGGASLACTILPLELFNLKAEAGKNEVNVLWATASERNITYHEVQRSVDGEHFAPIGRVTAAGYSQQRMDYAFVDPDPMNGANYYRLRSVEENGNWEYSDIVSAYFSNNALGTLEIHPNPASSFVRVYYTLAEDDIANWRMLDASGRLVASGTKQGMAGRDQVEIPLAQVESGSYVLHMFGTAGRMFGIGRFVVQ